MQYHSYNSLNATIKEQYSRPQETNDSYNYPQGTNQYQLNNQGSLMNYLTQGDLGQTLMNLYNIPTMNNLMQVTQTAMTPVEEPQTPEDRSSYLYVHNY